MRYTIDVDLMCIGDVLHHECEFVAIENQGNDRLEKPGMCVGQRLQGENHHKIAQANLTIPKHKNNMSLEYGSQKQCRRNIHLLNLIWSSRSFHRGDDFGCWSSR